MPDYAAAAMPPLYCFDSVSYASCFNIIDAAAICHILPLALCYMLPDAATTPLPLTLDARRVYATSCQMARHCHTLSLISRRYY